MVHGQNIPAQSLRLPRVSKISQIRHFDRAHVFIGIFGLSCTAPPSPSESKLDAEDSPIGVSLGLFASDPLWDYAPLIEEISDLGTGQISLVIPIHQQRHDSNAPSLAVPIEEIRRSIDQAQQKNLDITLMPLIKLHERRMDLWRGTLAPTDPDLWWRNYRSEIKRLAILAESEQVSRLVIGAELCSLEADEASWTQLISSTRKLYHGTLTYSANWDHYSEIGFWEDLDEIAVTAYFPIARKSQFEAHWTDFIQDIEGFARHQQRPLIITEYGYPALESALAEPWNETTQASFDPLLQAELVQRATQFLQKSIHTTPHPERVLHQAFLWNWFGFGGQHDHGFTLRGRAGEPALKKVLSQKHERP